VIESGGPRYQDVIVWDKQHFGMGTAFRKQHELIAHFSYDTPQYHDHTTGNVIPCKRVSIREHLNQKPVELLERLIRVVCPVGGTVLDPLMGVGSTGVACLTAGRNFIGIELNKHHFDIADRRLRSMEHQLRFSQPGPQLASQVVALPSRQLPATSSATTQPATQPGSS
jgi:site-specific DNA-methyltransferase (adenine-specific)